MKRKPPTRPDVIARVEATGLSDKDFLAKVGVYASFLSIARAGGVASHKSEASWKKILVGLGEPAETVDTSVPVDPTIAAAKAAKLAELTAACRAAKTPDLVEDFNRKLMEGGVDGSVAESTIRALAPLVASARQLAKQRVEREGDEAPEIVVKIEYVDSWREATRGERVEGG